MLKLEMQQYEMYPPLLKNNNWLLRMISAETDIDNPN